MLPSRRHLDLVPNFARRLFATVKGLLTEMKTPKTDSEVAADLQVSKSQAKEWLRRLVKEGVLEKLSKPA
jgi:DNA processing protein